MGRYYSGDIEGKFWFGVQDSDDASFFGGVQAEPHTINYEFTIDDLVDIRAGIEKCILALGENKKKLDIFFGKGGRGEQSYNDSILVEATGIQATEVREVLEWYARLLLGEKILKCVQETGYCNFEAEL